MTMQQGAVTIIQNSIPVRFSARFKVLPCSPDRVPQLSVDILYLIAQTLPRPKWVYNLARVNKQSWYYLQPALFQCEVTYEARLSQHFGVDNEPLSEASAHEMQASNIEDTQELCLHGLNTTLCEECGDRIAIEKVTFRANQHADFLSETGAAQVTALQWACAKGPDGVPAGLKAVRAASVHQPSYIDGKDLIPRFMGYGNHGGSSIPRTVRLCGDIPPPLFMAVAFGNVDLCKALIQAGCNVNLIQPGENCQGVSLYEFGTLFKIHDKCTSRERCDWDVIQWAPCRTAGHVALLHNRPAFLKLLLDGGLDPYLGRESLIHEAVHTGNRSTTRLLIDRYPELSRFQDELRECRSPLHELSNTIFWWEPWERPPRGLFKGIASDLMEKGASLEAIVIPSERYGMQGTPLQHALQIADQNYWYWRGNPVYVAEAFIQLGCVWSQPVNPKRPTESILDHCISRATLWDKEPDPFSWNQSNSEKHMVYTRLVKAIVESERGRVTLNAFTRKAFLDAFNDLAARSITSTTQYDAFATEVVGKLLLSTGITPDASRVSKWTQSIRKIQCWTAHSPTGRRRSLKDWEGIMSDWPTIHGGLEDEPVITGAPELLGLFSGEYWY